MPNWQTIELDETPIDPLNLNEDDSTEDTTGSLLEDDDAEVNLEVDTGEPDVNLEVDVVEEEDPTETPEDGEEVPKKQKAKKPNRSNKRIRELNRQKNEAYEAFEAERAAREDLQREILELKKAQVNDQKETVESSKKLIENHIEGLKQRIKRAHEEGNAEELVELQETLFETMHKKNSLESWEPEEIKEPVPRKAPKAVAGPDMSQAPEAMQDWLQDNPWFLTPRTQKEQQDIRKAVRLWEGLIEDEGMDPEDSEVYQIVNEKLGLATSETDTVDLDSSSKDVKKRSPRQTVQGRSRASTRSIQKSNLKKSPNKVKLTREQIEMADLMGITREQYARELIKMERSKGQGSKYTDLF
jgi:hypothetical protein